MPHLDAGFAASPWESCPFLKGDRGVWIGRGLVKKGEGSGREERGESGWCVD